MKTDFKQNLIFCTHVTISLILHSFENFSIFLSTLQPYTVSLTAYLQVELRVSAAIALASSAVSSSKAVHVHYRICSQCRHVFPSLDV